MKIIFLTRALRARTSRCFSYKVCLFGHESLLCTTRGFVRSSEYSHCTLVDYSVHFTSFWINEALAPVTSNRASLFKCYSGCVSLLVQSHVLVDLPLKRNHQDLMENDGLHHIIHHSTGFTLRAESYSSRELLNIFPKESLESRQSIFDFLLNAICDHFLGCSNNCVASALQSGLRSFWLLLNSFTGAVCVTVFAVGQNYFSISRRLDFHLAIKCPPSANQHLLLLLVTGHALSERVGTLMRFSSKLNG